MIPRHSVIVADDNEEVRNGFRSMLASEYEVLAVVENGAELVEAAQRLVPDLVVIDVSMPVLNGMEALKRLNRDGFPGKAVMMSMSADRAYVRRAFQLGALGFVWKGAGGGDLPLSLRTVMSGQRYVSPGIDREA